MEKKRNVLKPTFQQVSAFIQREFTSPYDHTHDNDAPSGNSPSYEVFYEKEYIKIKQLDDTINLDLSLANPGFVAKVKKLLNLYIDQEVEKGIKNLESAFLAGNNMYKLMQVTHDGSRYQLQCFKNVNPVILFIVNLVHEDGIFKMSLSFLDNVELQLRPAIEEDISGFAAFINLPNQHKT